MSYEVEVDLSRARTMVISQMTADAGLIIRGELKIS